MSIAIKAVALDHSVPTGSYGAISDAIELADRLGYPVALEMYNVTIIVKEDDHPIEVHREWLKTFES